MLRRDGPVLHRVDTTFWEYVETMDDRSMRCKFCGHFFAERTSITRIKHHLSGMKSGGAKNCAQVPQHVRDAALAAIDGPPAKKPKHLGGSSNNEVTNAISASAQQQNNEMMMAHQREDLSLEDWMASIPVEEMELLERGRFHERPSFNQADEHRGDPSHPTNDQLCSPSVNNDATMNVAQNVDGVQGMEQGGEEERLCSHLDMDNSMENTGEGSVQHVDRIVSPWRHAIDENYSRRGATERLVQPGVRGSSSGVNVNHTAISTSPQEQNNEVYNLTGDGTSIQAPDMYEKSWVEIINSLMDDGIQNAIGEAQPGAGASSSGVLKYNTSDHVKRIQSENMVKATERQVKMKKSASEKAVSLDSAEEEEREKVERRRPATTRASEKTVMIGDEEIDDFINRFKQQLKLQRLESLLRRN